MTVLIENYGCELNKAEMNSIVTSLNGMGIETTRDIKVPEKDIDAVIINTCSVRGSAEERVLGRIAHHNGLKKRNKKLGIYVTGCMADRIGDELKKRFKGITAVVKNNDKLSIPLMIKEENSFVVKNNSEYPFAKYYASKDDLNAYVPIMNGCNNFCSYCIVPYVRGREISRSIDDIIDEILYIDKMNIHVVTLLGQNVNSYAFEKNNEKITFNDLVKKIDSLDLKNIVSIRFESPHPKDFNTELIQTLKTSRYFSHHFHIPIQSGNSRILSLMNRKYTREQALLLFENIKKAIPDATFSLDLMVGFPSETKSEFNDTLLFVKEVGPIDAFMYYWNKREGTKAAEITTGIISEEQKVQRLETLIAFQRANAVKIKQGRIGMVRKVCASHISRNNKNEWFGFDTETLESVVFDCTNCTRGDIYSVRLESLNGNTYKASIVK